MPSVDSSSETPSATAPGAVGGGPDGSGTTSAPALRCRGVSRTFAGPRGPVPVLRGVDLVVERGEVVAILGPSGSGKSTLLHLLAGLDRLGSDMGAAAAPRTAAAAAGPAAGEIWWGDLAVHRHPPRRLARSRAEHVGLVFQNHYLLDDLTALENVTLPGRIRGDLDRERGAELLRAVGLEARADHRPARLSGGERQRVAVARALYHRPALLLADEPTGSLDRATANEVYRQLLAAAEREGAAVVVVTHDEAMVDDLPRRYLLTGGRLVPRGER